jgi:hypothetical protein
LPFVKGFESVGVADDDRGLMESTCQIFSCRKVDRCFSADRRIAGGKNC